MHRHPLLMPGPCSQAYALHRFAQSTGMIAVDNQHAFQPMPDVETPTCGMKHERAGAGPLAGRAVHPPRQLAILHRKYIQPVAAEVRRKQVASVAIKGERVGM